MECPWKSIKKSNSSLLCFTTLFGDNASPSRISPLSLFSVLVVSLLKLRSSSIRIA